MKPSRRERGERTGRHARSTEKNGILEDVRPTWKASVAHFSGCRTVRASLLLQACIVGCGPTARRAAAEGHGRFRHDPGQPSVSQFPLLPNPKPDVISCTYCARCVSKASGRGIVYILWKVGWKGFDFMSVAAR